MYLFKANIKALLFVACSSPNIIFNYEDPKMEKSTTIHEKTLRYFKIYFYWKLSPFQFLLYDGLILCNIFSISSKKIPVFAVTKIIEKRVYCDYRENKKNWIFIL